MTRPPNRQFTRSSDHPITRSSMFWRIWWRAVSVRRSQGALALGALAVGAAITSMLLNLYGGVRRKMTEDFRAYGANVVVAPAARGAPRGARSATTDEAALAPLTQFAAETPGTKFAPVLYGVVQVSPDSADPRLPEFTNAIAAGAEFGALHGLNPGWQVMGETISADLPPGTCALGTNLAARLHVRLGDSIDLRRVASSVAAVSDRRTFSGQKPPLQTMEADAKSAPPFTAYRVAAVLTTGASEDDQVFLPLATLQAILDLKGKVTLVQVSIPGETRGVEAAVHRLAGLLPGLEVHAIRQIVYSEGKVLGTIRWLLLSLTILILVIIALCVMATMTAIALERRKDIGVMKALGAADALLMRLFVTESASLGLVAGILGYGMGALLARGLGERVFGVALGVNAWTLPAVCGLTVALAVIATQVPVRVVRGIQPTAVLKGE